jgi:hypothetical protein
MATVAEDGSAERRELIKKRMAESRARRTAAAGGAAAEVRPLQISPRSFLRVFSPIRCSLAVFVPRPLTPLLFGRGTMDKMSALRLVLLVRHC